MKGYAIRDVMNGIDEPRGKTWFWELEAAVVDADLCVQCGACVAVCPSNSLGVNLVSNLPELIKMCTGCSLCWDFCPRAGLRYEATWHDADEATTHDADEAAPALAAAGGAPAHGADVGLGVVVTKVAVRARTAVGGAQDGGAVTAILGTLLEEGEIDGAVVATPSTRDGETWRGVATVATTRAELEAAAGSFYNQTMALAALDLSRVELPSEPRLALVGTPCEVQGLRAMQRAPWSTGAHRVDAVVLTIALMCTKSFDYAGLMRAELEERRGVVLGSVRRVDVTQGRLIVDDVHGERVVDEPVSAFHGAALRGCDECADFLGRAADLAIGSIGSTAGWSSVLARTEVGRAALERALGVLEVAPLEDLGPLRKLDAANRRRAESTLGRPIDPAGSLFISFDEHLDVHDGTDRAPVIARR